ncbi:hypothetical protein HNP86_001903 [Methanococcus maripaludis]|uniref:Uncharacterized protein n=1 Tax=Methanococcus maripaludis TaxID=39152 RepID=A0A7J9NWV7_METMI|nr:hypothetical protein [Methanococcus maripaludis]MBA2851744.1 hypothetical protein [Methanococcus maripaludis]
MLVTSGCTYNDKTFGASYGFVPASVFAFRETMKTTLDTLNRKLMDRQINDNINYYPINLDKFVKAGVLKTKQLKSALQPSIELDVCDVYTGFASVLTDMESVNVCTILDLEKLKTFILPPAAYTEYDYKYVIPVVELMYLAKDQNVISDVDNDSLTAYLNTQGFNPTITLPDNVFTYNNINYIYDDMNSLFSLLFSDMYEMVTKYTGGYIVNLKVQTSMKYEVVDMYPVNSDNYVNSKNFYYTVMYGNDYFIYRSQAAKTGEQITIDGNIFDDVELTKDFYITFYTKTNTLESIAGVLEKEIESVLSKVVEKAYPGIRVDGDNRFKPICRVSINDLTVDDISVYNSPKMMNNKTFTVTEYTTKEVLTKGTHSDVIVDIDIGDAEVTLCV